jgi:hypothetical protein
MLVPIAIAAVLFFAYALTFDKIGDAVPKRVSQAFRRPAAPDKTVG